MTAPSNRTYPVASSRKAWRKRKSFKDKLMSKTKTGLSEELKKAEKAWREIKFKDLDAKKQKARIITVNKIRIISAGKEVATAGAATWDRKVLKVAGITWKVGAASDYKGKTLLVKGETEGNVHGDGIG